MRQSRLRDPATACEAVYSYIAALGVNVRFCRVQALTRIVMIRAPRRQRASAADRAQASFHAAMMPLVPMRAGFNLAGRACLRYFRAVFDGGPGIGTGPVSGRSAAALYR
jgi:hypothetical protein